MSIDTTARVTDAAEETAPPRPPLTLVKDSEPTPTAATVDGAVVQHQGTIARPKWIESSKALAERSKNHAVDNRLYVGWTVRGYRELGRCWLDAHRDDYPQMLASARAELKAAKGDTGAEAAAKQRVKSLRAEYRVHKRWHWIKTGGWGTAGSASATTAVVVGSGWIDVALAVGAMVTGAWHGRPEQREAPEAPKSPAALDATDHGVEGAGRLVFMTVDQLAEDGKPFPIRTATSPMQAAECVLRGLLAEGVPVVEVSDIEQQPWGWQCVVRVAEGTPEAIIKVAGDLETRYDLPTNGVKVQPLTERRSCAILRLVHGDPFATAPGLPYRAPKSMSITSKARIGTSVGGDPLLVSLSGVMGVYVAASGGGKTGLLQTLGEYTTACSDNVTIDLDPHGDGLEDLHDAVRVTARTTEQIEAVLLFLLALSKGRARLRKKLGMGKKWQVSPEHPHITVIFDEFPKASDLAKRLAFDLLLVGRKEAVALELASQGGTKLYLGENIAQMIALKAVGPCKVGDTRAVFGEGSVSEGWLPHKLAPATDTDAKDAGHIYIQGVPGLPDEPIEYAVHETPSATLQKLAAERREAGLVEPDQDSLEAMRGVDLPDYVQPTYDNEGCIKKPAPVELLTWDELLRLCDADPAEHQAEEGPARAAVADAVDLMDKAGVDRMRTETLVAALADHDPGAYGDLTAEELKDLFAEAGAGKPVTLGPLDGMANPRGFKRDALTSTL